MKTAALLVAASALFASTLLVSPVQAQSAPATNVPPPPGINDPGVQAVAPPATTPRPVRTPTAKGDSLDLKPQALPAMRDGDSKLGRPAEPEVRVHQEGDNSVQEYSRSGQVYMLVVTPKHGVPQTYMVNPDGRVVDEHGKKPVGPVMYKVLEWGKSKPAAEDSDATPSADDDH
ncbi:DUF2782 domain-containing protein [Rhodanobacter sp. Col0626]|uniref:DUF2782 domain-containing protein n=1 Tax=Rhodanobacter sp. Col0626 TaxID=3415679 RepID=UPI003CE89518